MQQPLIPPITIEMMRSTLLLGLQSAIAIVSAFCISQLPVSGPLKLLAMIALSATTLYFIMRDALLLLPWSWRAIRVDSQGVLHLTSRKGVTIQPLLSATTFIHPQLIILNLQATAGLRARKAPVILFAEQTTQQNHRRLRVWLLWWNKQQR